MDKDQEERLKAFIGELDELIAKHSLEFAPHNISGMLLSRVTLLMSDDPETGKGLLKFVWERLDELEQSNPGNFL
jgi:hypothetical protein